MAFKDAPRFPDTLALGAIGGPMFSTSITATLNNHEQRNQNWRYPRGCWEVGQVNRTAAETQTLVAFFRSVAQGRLHGFRFKDPLPGESIGVDEPLGIGNDSTTVFQLIKRYTSGASVADRPILKPIISTLVLKSNGGIIPIGEYEVNAVGEVEFLTAPATGETLTATFEFDVPVRFDTDRLPIQRVAPDVYTWQSVKLWEERRANAAEGTPLDPFGPDAPTWSEAWEYVLPSFILAP